MQIAILLYDRFTCLDAIGPWRLLLLPDHATPLVLKTHTSDPVPYLLVDSRAAGRGGTYTERGTADGVPVPAAAAAMFSRQHDQARPI